MLFAQQVVYCLNRIKRGERNFYEYSVPIAHRTVPQARKFERFQVFSVLRFVGNEARCLIHVVQQVELVAFVIANGANQIYRIEVRALFEHGFLFRIFHVYLRAFQNLQ